jgi:hypothetical protein
MRFSTSLLVTGLLFACGCGGRSGHDGSSGNAATGGSGATAGHGGAPTAGTSGTSATSGSGGTTGGTGGASAGSGGSLPAAGSSGASGSGAAGRGGSGAAGGANGGRGGSEVGGASGASGARSCEDLATEYAQAIDDATTCDPKAAVDECTKKIDVGLECGCSAFVNPANADAIARMSEAQSAYYAQECRGGVTCGECLPPIRGACSAAGLCENVYPGGGRSCKVAGVVYADGEGGIPDPTSCNTCSCMDGQLACTEIGGCEKPCPDGYAFGSDCAQCGPTDACEIPEYDCFETCTDSCAGAGYLCLQGLCVDGICG